MNRRRTIRTLLFLGAGMTAFSLPAYGRRGRPLTPTSVGGVRRRTRRRTRRRIHRNMRLTSLPYGCATTRVSGGVTFYYCSGIWYRPTYSGTTVVYVVERIDDGANTEVEFEE